MSFYKQLGLRLQSIKEKPIDLEKSVQTLVENNLSDIFGLEFVTTEFQLNNLRIDTLAYDAERKAFVVIEYKKDRNFTVVDQGYAYLALILNNKADFVLEFNERKNVNLRKDDIEWSQLRVIFIAPSFTKYQQGAMGFNDLPIELWEVKRYEHDLISFNQIKVSEKSQSIKVIAKGKDAEVVSREISVVTVEDHLRPNWDKARELFETLSQRVLELDSRFELHPVKSYIGFNIEGKNVIVVKIRQAGILLELLRTRPEDLKDLEQRTRYMAHSFERLNQHVTQFDIESEDDIDYAMMLIKQVYQRFIS